MDWRLEAVVVPVTDVEAAKDFYAGRLGFRLDADTWPTPEMRVVQLTPPGSACSITIGPVLMDADLAEQVPRASLQLVVPDLKAARAELVERGVEVSVIEQIDTAGTGRFMFFTDPDGNTWAVQELERHVGAEL